jgi:N,N'-diacetyllegionaminate synthase
MKINNHDLNNKVLIVAEIGNNHEGDFSVAQELIGKASESGADAVKFQTFIPEHISGGDPPRLKRLQKFCLTNEQFEKLAKLASDQNIIFFSTPFDLESAKFLDTIQPVFKIASSDNDYLSLIKTVASFGKPMIVSCGIAELNLIDIVCSEVNEIWSDKNINPGLALLHCVSSYPTPPEQANLNAITTIKKRFTEQTIGYSDHTLGVQAAVSSVALGARIVEKHFTLDKNYSDFRDHQISADPEDLKQMVEKIREVELMLGTGEKILQQNETEILSALRRSIAASKNLPIGTKLTKDDLIWVRPGTGITMGKENQIIGKRLRRPISYGELISLEDVDD